MVPARVIVAFVKCVLFLEEVGITRRVLGIDCHSRVPLGCSVGMPKWRETLDIVHVCPGVQIIANLPILREIGLCFLSSLVTFATVVLREELVLYNLTLSFLMQLAVSKLSQKRTLKATCRYL